MNVKDLRVGNVVQHGLNIKQVYKIGNKSIDFYIGTCKKGNIYTQSFYTEAITGIFLTEEWLLKFGFVKDIGKHGEYYMHSKYCGFRVLKSDITSCWVIGRKQFDNNVTYWIAVLKYVHQLQNLYYALTSEELQVTL